MFDELSHSERSNCRIASDVEGRRNVLPAARAIEAGEELTVDYGIPLWFEYCDD